MRNFNHSKTKDKQLNLCNIGTAVDRLCRVKTAEWVRAKYEAAGGIPDIENIGSDSDLCKYYEGYMKSTDDILLNKGIYTLEDLKEFGEKKNT